MPRFVLLLSLIIGSLQAQDLTSGLIGCYSFSGNANDGSGHHHNGILHGYTSLSVHFRFGDGQSAEASQPVASHQYHQAGNYNVAVIVTDSSGCKASCSDEVNLFDVFIPNVITVNGDDLNSRFTLVEKLQDHYKDYSGPLPFSMKITDRLGKEIYATTNIHERWNAAGADSGVYYYWISFGSTTYKGWITVLN
jgi:hypothetical protein